MSSKTNDDRWRQKLRRMAEVERRRVSDNRDESTISESSSSSSPQGQILHDGDDNMNVSYESDSNDSDNDETEAGMDECEQGRVAIRNLSSSSNLNHVQIKNLLKTLRAPPFNLLYLPKDPRTLLQTPTIVVRNIVRNRAGGRYLHFGFKISLLKS